MGVVTNEPSMEDILSSIKRIIADGSDRTAASGRVSRRRGGTGRDGDEDADAGIDADEHDPAILELTDMVEDNVPVAGEPAAAAPEPTVTLARKGAAKAASQPAAPTPEEQILSDVSAQAARQSLSQLSSLLVRPQDGESNTLEGLVREMLRPMLKEWLEAKLPELVESLVKKEIDRIVGRLG
ncbi:MAG: DUF2497 domain-containing protein [Sphingobium sp.]